MKTSTPSTYMSLLIMCVMLQGCASLTASYFMKDPLSAEEHNNLGVIYEREGEYELALGEYKKAIDKDGPIVTTLVNTGNVYFKLGQLTNAETYYKRALGKDEKNLVAANNLASLYIGSGAGHREGLGYMLRAVENVEAIPPFALDTIGVLYIKIGDKEAGRDLLFRACRSEGIEEAILEQIKTHLAEIGETCKIERRNCD